MNSTTLRTCITRRRQNHEHQNDPPTFHHIRTMRPAEQKIIAIAKKFPALTPHVQSLTSWDIDSFMEWLPRSSTGERHAMLFVAVVWNPTYAAQQGWEFNIVRAAGDWDQQHHNAFLAWAMNPEWP